MIWAIASSVFVIYLYRKLNATSGAATDGGEDSNPVDTELAKLNGRIEALESMAAGKIRRMAP